MPIARIERIVGGVVRGTTEPGADGQFACHAFGSNIDPIRCANLDDVAAFLRANPGGGIRMNPGWVKITKNIYIDGILLR